MGCKSLVWQDWMPRASPHLPRWIRECVAHVALLERLSKRAPVEFKHVSSTYNLLQPGKSKLPRGSTWLQRACRFCAMSLEAYRRLASSETPSSRGSPGV
eukprot:536614-Amphidinium_carterae.1